MQIRIDEIDNTADELSKYFAEADICSEAYAENSIKLSKVKALIGNTPIEKSNPSPLLAYFRQDLS